MMVDEGGHASKGRVEEMTAVLERADAALRVDDVQAIADLFAPDARLMWPGIEGIVGREAIRAAFERLFAEVHTISWQADNHVLDVHDDRAYVLGRFREVRRDHESGEVEHVPGRLVSFWRRQPDGGWLITHLLTSRYGPEEIEPADG